MDVSDLSVKQLLKRASQLESQAEQLPTTDLASAAELRREAQDLRDLAAEKDQWS